MDIKNKFLLTIAFLSFHFAMSAQFYSAKQHISYADQAFEVGNFIEAMTHYQKAMELNDDVDALTIYNYGEAAYNSYSLGVAEEMFNKYLTMDGVENQHLVQYRLAKLKHLKGDYAAAVTDYDIFLSEYESVDPKLTEDVLFQKESADWALNTPAESLVDSISQVDNGVNTAYSEHAPFVFKDELYYNALKFPVENKEYKRFTSKLLKQNGELNVDGFSDNQILSHPSFSPDGKYMFFTVGEYKDLTRIICDIYYCPVDEYGQLGPAKMLPNGINQDGYTATHPAVYINPDSSYQLLFVSDRHGGKGGLDIWTSRFNSNFEFSEIVNLFDVNTSFDEVSPFAHQKTGNLYFSSNGRSGFGGFDVYESHIDKLSETINLGGEINSPNNDLYYFLTEDASKAYLSSNRPGSMYLEDKFETCCYDIYEAKSKECTIKLEASTFDAITQQSLTDVNIKIWNPSTGEIAYNSSSAEPIRDIVLPCDEDLEMVATKAGYKDVIISLGDMEPVFGEENKVRKSIFMIPTESVTLRLKIFEEISEKALAGTDVYITKKGTTEQKTKLANPSHIVEFKIEPNTEYIVEINKDGYKEAVLEINAKEDESLVERNVTLKILDVVKKAVVTLENAIPVSLYFDNDMPKNGATNITSPVTYTETFDAYYAKKDKFKINYISSFRGDNKVTASSDINNLFESHIKYGFDKYDNFKRQLLLVLQSGQDVNIYLRGYASPVAQSEYNSNLGKRRVDSVRKEFDRWNGGVLLPYIKSGQLKVTERSFGEETAPAGISDDASNPDRSIFSPEASKERRVEIDEINFNEQN